MPPNNSHIFIVVVDMYSLLTHKKECFVRINDMAMATLYGPMVPPTKGTLLLLLLWLIVVDLLLHHSHNIH
jgi:hypothetical protein